jgi:hypothetical protein
VNLNAKTAGLIGTGVLIAGAGFWFWQQFHSRNAQIASLHRACIAEFAESAARMKAGVQPGDASSGIVKGLSESLGKVLEGMSEGMGDTVCGTLRDSCRNDFEGRICTAARDRYL